MTKRVLDPQQASATGKTAAGMGWLLCLITSLFLAGCSTYGPERPGEKIYRDVEFAAPGGRRLCMDLYVPKTAKPAPVVLWMFGGGWRFGSKGYHVNVRDLTSVGIAVASIQYRLSQDAVYPAQLEDCCAAAEWLRVNGARYGIDATRMGASGESSGGHLATMLAAKAGKSRIQAVCALYSPTDLNELGALYAKPGKESLIDKFLGGTLEQKYALAADASPLNYISSSLPPFLIIHGERDRVVPLEHSERLFFALADAGVDAQFIVVPGKGHWFRLDDAQFSEVSRFFQVNLGR
ncbi:alpha/beta hydrolase [Prosthecobacter sp.]|uniref:alpha/beta hydrolase n=1 Tax=Prosthecobacter sp. TaxID=1965333 RepID=UPI002487F9B4|nr:alpha/beta hydrolase [Prosthecobacter sp.]MDI1311079.1 alpha/beta hydrolase [Prosthecobacter sp.]